MQIRGRLNLYSDHRHAHLLFTISIQVWFGCCCCFFFNYYGTLRCYTSYCDCTGQKVFYLYCFMANDMRVVFLIFSYMTINYIPNVFNLSKLFWYIVPKIHCRAIPNDLAFSRCNTDNYILCNTGARISPEGRKWCILLWEGVQEFGENTDLLGKDTSCINMKEWVLHLIFAPSSTWSFMHLCGVETGTCE